MSIFNMRKYKIVAVVVVVVIVVEVVVVCLLLCVHFIQQTLTYAPIFLMKQFARLVV